MMFEISGVRNRMVWPYLPTAHIIHRQNWFQNALKNRFPIRDVEQPILYQFQKKSYFKKKILHLFLKH